MSRVPRVSGVAPPHVVPFPARHSEEHLASARIPTDLSLSKLAPGGQRVESKPQGLPPAAAAAAAAASFKRSEPQPRSRTGPERLRPRPPPQAGRVRCRWRRSAPPAWSRAPSRCRAPPRQPESARFARFDARFAEIRRALAPSQTPARLGRATRTPPTRCLGGRESTVRGTRRLERLERGSTGAPSEYIAWSSRSRGR